MNEITDSLEDLPTPIPSPSPSPSPSPLPSQIILTDEQNQAIDLILSWLFKSPRQVFKLGGYAGTGKTTIIRTLIERLDDLNERCVVMAFTGKACSVLCRKNVPAGTIHSNIYNCECDNKGNYTFTKRASIPLQPRLIIIDEASMISTDLWEDLLSFKHKILCVGDPGQLEPVGDNPNLMHEQDFCLSKIHRQAEKSPIITLAHQIRSTGILPSCKETPELSIRSKRVDTKFFSSVSQVICAKNATRNSFNASIRQLKGFSPCTILPEEKLICLKNNLRFGIYNGLICFVKSVVEHEDYFMCQLVDEINTQLPNIKIWKAPFLRQLQQGEFCPPYLAHFDYGYAITCHKSQGSEWNNVALWFECMPPKVWDNKRWLYTGITRASKQLTLFK
jgi:exodeoxyribonuclease-5